MKLQCQIEVINRLHNSLNIRTNGRYLKSTLAIGKEPRNDKEYFILHFSSVNKSGTKYRVKNIKQVFVKCLNEGKATIRFEEPPHDLCIKSECVQLKCFMKLLKSCITGATQDLKFSDLSSISVTGTNNTPTKLIIRNRNGFPTKGLPRTLESLFINGLKLCNFRREILLLHHLVILDLSNNEIESIPPEFSRMRSLCELYLANNQIGIKAEVDWSWLLGPQITKTLKLLDLSGNKLKYLPKSVWKLQKLVTLKLDNNILERLPASLGRISTLRYFTVSQNSLRILPCSLIQCRLEHIDVSCNQFHTNFKLSSKNTPWRSYVGSLVNLSAKVVLKYKLFYAPNIIPWTLVDFLDNSHMCVCGAPVSSDTSCSKREFELKDCFRVVVFDNDKSSTVGFECYFCSPRCYLFNS